jgi:hypothetical protein
MWVTVVSVLWNILRLGRFIRCHGVRQMQSCFDGRVRQNCEKCLLSSLCLSVRMQQLSFHWTHILFWVSVCFRKSWRLCDNVEEYQATAGHITQRMRIACWITKATDIHPDYVILIVFQRQQCLLEWASIYSRLPLLLMYWFQLFGLVPCFTRWK